MNHRFPFLFFLCLVALFGCGSKNELPPSVKDQLLSDTKLGEPVATTELDSASPSEPAPIIDNCDITAAAWIQPNQLPWSYAEVQYVGNTRIGFSKVAIAPSSLTELNQLHIQRTDIVERTASGSPIPIRRVEFESFERANGELSGFRFVSTIDGQNDLSVEGNVVHGQLEVVRREGTDASRRERIAWQKEFWGPFGIQSILMRSPMQPGENRQSQIFLPQLVKFVPIVLQAKASELTPMPNGKVEPLLLIEVTIGTAESGVLSSVYCNEQGVIQKSIARSGPAILSVSVADAVVQRLSDQLLFTRGVQAEVPFQGDAIAMERDNSIQLSISAEDIDPYDVLLRYHRQLLTSVSANVCQVAISIGPSNPLDHIEREETDESCLAASPLIPADKELIQTVAKEFAGSSASSPTETAQAIRQSLHGKWQIQSDAAEISSTLAAARELRGGAIECAQLLTALLRSQQIPARIVAGIRLDSASSSGRFHAWVQAWLNDEWVDLDATIPGEVRLNHLAMQVNSGDGENAYAHYMPTIEAIKKLKGIQVVTESN